MFGLVLTGVLVTVVVLTRPDTSYDDFADPPPNNTAYSIQLVLSPSVRPTHLPAIYRATTRWQRVINETLPFRVSVTQIELEQNCGVQIMQDYMDVEDIVVFVSVVKRDGQGGLYGSAGWCILDTAKMPRVAVLMIDSEDITSLVATRTLESVVMHEMGHCLGIGTLWEIRSVFGFFVRQYVSPSTSNPPWFFLRPNAQLGESEVTGEEIGPYPEIESEGSVGTTRSHWSKRRYGNELMTGYITGTNQPLSALSIRSLVDIGYKVDVAQADAFCVGEVKRFLREDGQQVDSILVFPVAYASAEYPK